ncbi:MAG: FHA domain-containing protein [Gloeomargaritaceae cyanobacterium C42_A2020_066]|nr:FHA domain-containing protein [Gloeomargaritaceae cyanobacterium C42_A2020_066]
MSPDSAYLEVYSDGVQSVVSLDQERTTLGTDPSSNLVLQNPSLGDHCLEIVRKPEGYLLTVFETNALVTLNGRPLGPWETHPLHPSDTLTLGSYTFQFYGAAPEPPVPSTNGQAPDLVSIPGFEPEAPTFVAPPSGSPPIPVLGVLTPQGTQQYPLVQDSLTLGRHPACDIVIDVPVISARHARLHRVEQGYEIEDLGSSNGIYYQGERIQRRLLRDGDTLQISRQVTLSYALGVSAEVNPTQQVAPHHLVPPRTLNMARPAGDQTILLTDDPGSTTDFDLEPLDLHGRPSVTIGRDAASDLAINHPTVSRRHARIDRQDGSFVITDLGSTNGTFVNGKAIKAPCILRAGDTIRIGSECLVLNIDETLTRRDEKGNLRIDAIRLNKVVKSGTQVLNEVSLSIMPREFVAILGPSGSGKSTLLDALNGLRPATGGTVLVNGVDLYRNFSAYHAEIGYVPQKNIIHEELTVYQALDYAAQLRMPWDTTPTERQQRINEVLSELGLSHRRDVAIKALSGGQQRRVCIGVELLTKPSLFFLDEATSGLDPGTEADMMDLLRQLADQGRTILLITHATQNVELCDHIIYMAEGGRLAYFGPPDQLIPYFRDNFKDKLAGFKLRDITAIYRALDKEKNPKAPTAVELQETFRQSPQYQRYVASRQQRLEHSEKTASTRMRPPETAASQRVQSFWRQLCILSARNLTILSRDRGSLILMLALAPLLGSLDFVTWRRDLLDPTTGNAPLALSMMFVTALFAVLIGQLTTTWELVKEVEVYRRERMVGLQLAPYILSKVWIAVLLAAYQGAAFLLMKKLAVDLPGGLQVTLEMYVTLTLTIMGGMMLGLLVSAVSPNQNSALYLTLLVLAPQIIFSGGIQPVSSLGPVGQFFNRLTITKWPYEALVSLSGLGTDLVSDPCWTEKTAAQREALTDAQLASCRCLGPNIFRSCNFPGIRDKYNPAVDEPAPVKPEEPGSPPTNPADFAAFQDKLKAYQAAIQPWQTQFTDWQTRRSRAINEAEGLLNAFFRDNRQMFNVNIWGYWRSQVLLILGMLVIIPFLQKRKDFA